jgi:LCP family protein required for cell wall assembly
MCRERESFVNHFRRFRTLWISVLAVLIIGTAVGYANRGALAVWGYDQFLSKQVEQKLAGSYQPLKSRQTSAEAPAIVDPFSMLLMGVDARAQERGRSDTLIYTVVRPKDGQVLMVSIPRDTYADIVGKDTQDKITHAYAFGGPDMAVASVESLLQARIDHYASINFQGFVQVVDTLGGVPLPITEDIINKGQEHEKFTIKANQSVYRGQDALNFVRYREDAGDDVSRTERNRQFLDALMHKSSSLGQWTKIPEILGIIGENFRTDITPSDMTQLAKQFLQNDRRIQSYTLKGEGKRMGDDNLWYYALDADDLQAVRSTIAAWLNPLTPLSSLTVPTQAQDLVTPQATSPAA